ncbi:tetratricopeptide repeat (TPR)-like superfamily protein isoform X1 [Tasmannia lanceolata]|uniref:tetratricopeptide repeat (TPR)-like superfamily protein isoform X1 n=2 Tax=Tasmannia lanceolata TaxID=3420 RepID=UPI0040633337
MASALLLLSPPFYRNLSSQHCQKIMVHMQVLPQQRIKLYPVPLRKGYALQWFSTTASLKLLSTSPKNLQSRSKALVDNSSITIDDVNDIERELQEFFTEVKSMLVMGNQEGAIDLLQANYVSVKGQMDAGAKGMEQAAILDVIALGYMGVGDFEFVQCLLGELREIVDNAQNDEQFLDSILMHMGSMYATLGKFEDAMLVYQRGLEILERLFGINSTFLITPLLGMAKVFGLIRRSTKAIEVYRRAITILEMSRGVECEDLVIPLFGLGNVFIKEGRAEDAESSFNRIVNIYTGLYGANDGRVGMAMCSLAHAMCAKGTVNEAISVYRKGLQVIKNSNYMALDDDVMEKMRLDLAELLHVAGREQEGRELLEECLLISERHKGHGHPSSVTHLLNLASSYSRSKNFVEAERLLRTSLRIMSEEVDPADQSITVPMLHLAVTLYHLKQDEEAERLALEAVRIREDSFGKKSLPVGEALDCLASIQTRLGKDHGEILELLKRVLNIQEKELGYESEEVMITLKKIVFFLDKMGKKDEKLPFQRRLSLLRTKSKQRVPA